MKPIGSINQPFFAGIPTFFRARFVGLEELRPGDLAVVGAPFDGGISIGRPGARYGPRAIREASCHYSAFHYSMPDHTVVDLEKRVSTRIPDELRLFDLGDVDCHPADITATTNAIATAVEAIVNQGALPLILGGDHHIAYAAFKGSADATAAKHPGAKIGYLHIDSHADLSNEFAFGGRFNHATGARRVSEHPSTSISEMVWIGLTGLSLSLDQYDFVQRNQVLMLTSSDVNGAGWEEKLRSAIERVSKCDFIYASIDIDVVDGSQARGTGSAVFNGIHATRLLWLMEEIAHLKGLIGVDCCEVAPQFDRSGHTERLAALALVRLIDQRLFEHVAIS